MATTKKIDFYNEYHEKVGEAWVGPDYQREFGEKAAGAMIIGWAILLVAMVIFPLYGLYRIATPGTGIIKTAGWIGVVGFALILVLNFSERNYTPQQQPMLQGTLWLIFFAVVGAALFVRFCRTGGFKDVQAGFAALDNQQQRGR